MPHVNNMPANAGADLTFADLIAENEHREIVKHGDDKTAKSDMTMLNNFMKRQGLTRDDRIEGHLGMSWEVLKKRVDAYLATTALTQMSKTVYRSRAKKLNMIAQDMRSVISHEERTLPEILNMAFAKQRIQDPTLKKAEFARKAGMSPQMFGEWTSLGRSRPTASEKNREVARKLAVLLGISEDLILSKLIPIKRSQFQSARELNKERSARKEGVNPVQISYRALTLPPRIERFFQDVIRFKTNRYPGRNFGGEYLLTGKYAWRTNVANPHLPTTAKIWLMNIQTYVGWLMLPATPKEAYRYIRAYCKRNDVKIPAKKKQEMTKLFIGCGLKAEDIHPMHLIDPTYMQKFILWLGLRGHQNRCDYIHQATALINPVSGFLTQQVEYIWDYPGLGLTPVSKDQPDWEQSYKIQHKKWIDICSTWRNVLKDKVKNIPKKAGVIKGKLKPILDKKKDIIGLLGRMVSNHASDRPPARLLLRWGGSVQLAVWIRDQLLLRMLITNPLRQRNYAEMTYRDDPRNPGNLRKGSEGDWRIVFPPEAFKNERGAARKEYDVEVPQDLWPLIEEYLVKARPILLRHGKATDRVFVSKDGNELNDGRLSHVVFSLTARFGDLKVANYGIRMHAFRHLIATAWLRAHRYDFYTVAHILHDDLETVMRNYAHDDPEEVLKELSDFIALPPLRGSGWRMAA